MAKTATFTVTQEGQPIGPIFPVLGTAQVLWRFLGLKGQPSYGIIVFKNVGTGLQSSYKIGKYDMVDFTLPIEIAAGTYNVHLEHKQSATGYTQITETEVHTFEDGEFYELTFTL